ncbi:phage tail sheath family protein [Archangium lansingense]|uniref:phage tail sheath family protein n=1 Tax=Archangium lansingense TaxID=2995310 RepID=UPI003B76A551
MPEYLAPAVYIEETSFRAKSIEGVSTSTTGFAGPTLIGPHEGVPELLTSFADFERIYGGLENFDYGLNYLAHSVRAYFNEGGSRLYVARVLPSGATGAKADVTAGSVSFVARFNGKQGNGTIHVEAIRRPVSVSNLDKAPIGSVMFNTATTPVPFLKKSTGWADGSGTALAGLPSDTNAVAGNVVTLTIRTRDGAGRETIYEDVGLDPKHPRWIGSVLSEEPSRQSEVLQRLYAIQIQGTPPDGLALHTAILTGGNPTTYTLTGGTDGAEPTSAEYETALGLLAGIEDVSILAAPGSSTYGGSTFTTARAVRNALISYAEKRRAYRIAVLDTPKDQLDSGAKTWRGEIDSKHAALYYPWVVVANPLARPGDESIPKELTLPPSGFVSGIYARNDVERGVFKAPANEVVRSALRFEKDVNFAQQEVLNPLGINCLRFFPGRGFRVWGARTVSSDPEWKYVNVRRYFNFLERSIDVGTQWAVFEPNGERLWTNIRETIGSFLDNQWRSGALLGSDPKQAYFVRCDRSTMTQDDLDNGRLVCLVGVAVVKPAEFVIFRIGQKTADARS